MRTRYEKVVKTPCPACQSPLLELVSFCCCMEVYMSCRKCGEKHTLPIQEGWKLLENPHVSGGFDALWQHEPTCKDPMGYNLKKLPDEEYQAFLKLMEENGYTEVKGTQLGFVGNKQVFDPPIQL